MNNVLYVCVGRVLYEKILFHRHVGYWPNLANPKSFNEKTCAYKLFNSPRDAHLIADKVAVRELVAQRIGGEYLNDIYFAGDSPDAIDWKSLPNSFVAKGNHGSGDDYFILVDDKLKTDESDFKKRLEKILKLRFGYTLNEQWYLQIKPQILIEKRLTATGHSIPPDYKFFVFNGKVKLILVATGRYGDIGLSFYNPQWKRYDFSICYPMGLDIAKPNNLQAMIEIAEKLGQPYEFVRVDLYNLDNDKIVFGELTLAHGSGRYPFIPDKSADFMVGTFW
ncbi:MAG: hypothetical protein K2Q32_08360 [Alphaproteobacteria bacterium]|nr:hypothetical protein [Alphaproteobacteria bacterium]